MRENIMINTTNNNRTINLDGGTINEFQRNNN